MLTNSCCLIQRVRVVNTNRKKQNKETEKCIEKQQYPNILRLPTKFKMQFIVYYIMIYASLRELYKPFDFFLDSSSFSRCLYLLFTIFKIDVDKLIGFNNRINLNLSLSNRTKRRRNKKNTHTQSSNRVSTVFFNFMHH